MPPGTRLGARIALEREFFRKASFPQGIHRFFMVLGGAEGIPGELARRPGGAREHSLEHSGHPRSA